MYFKRAIVRPPGSSFARGITSADMGAPDLDLALDQHQAYCAALERCGVSLTVMEPDDEYPDSTFVEDTAVLTRQIAVLARPGAPSRRGEVGDVKSQIAPYYERLHVIQSPGTLDGGDICQVEDHFFIGVSARTNAEGARQLASVLAKEGYSSSLVDLRGFGSLLHLKSGIAYPGDGRLVLVKGMQQLANFDDYEIIYVDKGESYAANCVRVNDYVLVADGYPGITAQLSASGYQVLPVQVSEFQKMDGGLSCMSLRF